MPKVGDIIYVPHSLYVYRGRDDFHGGKARVSKVQEQFNSTFVHIEARPGTGYNWAVLEKQQDELQARFGDTWAYPDPDNHPDVNDSEADWVPYIPK